MSFAENEAAESYLVEQGKEAEDEAENEAVAIMADKWQNKNEEVSHDKGRNKKTQQNLEEWRKSYAYINSLRKAYQEKNSGLGGKVYGIREGAGEYDAAEGISRNGEDVK